MTGSQRIGALVPQRFDGVVASVHPRRQGQVVNITVEDELGPFFVSLITDEQDLTAGAMMLSGTVEPGAAVARRGEVLMLAGRQVSLGHLQVWDGRPRLSAPEAARITAPAAVAALHRTLFERQEFHRGLALLLHQSPGDPALRDPWLERARRVVADAAGILPVQLVGLGPGFTPAGDDFLAGVLLARSLTAEASQTTAIQNRLRTTTTGGATLLRHALSGAFPFYLIKICGILADPDTDESAKTLRACRIAAEHGHSSGIDSLTGLLWCLSGGDTSVFPTTLDDRKRG